MDGKQTKERIDLIVGKAQGCFNKYCIMSWWVEMMYQQYPDEVMKALEEMVI